MVATPKPRSRKSATQAAEPLARQPLWRRVRYWIGRALLGLAAFYGALIILFAFVPPPINLYQIGESWRLGGITKDWVAFEDISPVMARSVVAAEDANFCLHWGFDVAAIREALAEGSARGASTLTQQVAKNTFLWHGSGRPWIRKALEAPLTQAVEIVWTKRRILEVYLNVAEFDEGVFGVQAAAQHYFDVDASDLSDVQAARLAAVLPDPKRRSASAPSDYVRKRTRAIIAGAETIDVDGRASCFQPAK
jgi:monofunctional biosynthetic peptidoglycan transglycosylase